MGKRLEAIPITVADFSGGEADLPFMKMPPKFSTRMVNVYPTAAKGVDFVPGFARVNTTPAGEAFTSGHVFIKKDGTKIILVAGGSTIYKVVGATLVSIKTGLNASATVRFFTASNTCIMVNGVDAPMKYDGTTVTSLGGTPPATAFKGTYHKSRVWFIEHTDKMIASHSALLNLEDYTTAIDAGYLDFTKILKSGDELTDIESYMDLLIFYFKNHILVYSGSNPTSEGDFQLYMQIEGAGAVTDTVGSFGLDHLILSQIGVRSLRQLINSGTTAESLISKNIMQRMAGAYSTVAANGPFGNAHFQRLGWWMLLIGDTLWCYAYNLGAWFRISGMEIYGIFSDSDGSNVYLCGRGLLYKFDQGWTFDGVPIAREWNPAWMHFFRNGEKGYPKTLEIFAIPGAPVTINVGSRFDNNTGNADSFQSFTMPPAPSLMDEWVPDIWDNCFFMDPEEFLPTVVPLFGGGVTTQLVFSSQDTDGPCEISGLKINVVPGGA